MKRPAIADPLVTELINHCLKSEIPLDQRQAQLKALRQESPALGDMIDRVFLERLDLARAGLQESQQCQTGLKQMLDKVLSTPWFPAVFLKALATASGPRAIVSHNGSRRVVNLAPQLKVELLRVGEEVFLNNELNVITEVSQDGLPLCGELAMFDRRTPEGSLVIKWRDDEIELQPAYPLIGTTLQSGDLVRFDRTMWMAWAKVENVQSKEFMLEEVPDLTRDLLGGQDANYEQMLTTLSAIVVSPEKAMRYRLNGRNSILLVGPPGCGKTHMTRIVVSEIARLSGRKARFGVVKPAAWESPYVGVTQKAIRDTFKTLRTPAHGGISFLLIDEIESIARTRGHFANIHSDKALAALLAELDGFEDRTDIAVIAATNRKDLLDPAVLGRFGEEVPVGRPDQCAANAIFRIHLPKSLPFSPDGELAASTHNEIIETAVSLLYAPNADNAICRLRFRDGKDRTIHARELVSGRFFKQICEKACRRAYAREGRGGDPGINTEDMEQAVATGMQRLRTQLTPINAHSHLSDLPQDVDVVSVEPVIRKVGNARRYLNLEPV